MDTPTQLIRERLVDFPTDGVGRDGTLVWLLAYAERLLRDSRAHGFNGHPPLGVNATGVRRNGSASWSAFQWAPTLGGECYEGVPRQRELPLSGFNGHPPLGVNATV